MGMVDQVFVFTETLEWRVRVQYDPAIHDGRKLALEAVLHQHDTSAAIEVSDEGGMDLFRVFDIEDASEPPPVTLTAEEIMSHSGSGWREPSYFDAPVKCPICQITDCRHIPFVKWVNELAGNLILKEGQDVLTMIPQEMTERSYIIEVYSDPDDVVATWPTNLDMMREVYKLAGTLDEVLTALGYNVCEEWDQWDHSAAAAPA